METVVDTEVNAELVAQREQWRVDAECITFFERKLVEAELKLADEVRVHLGFDRGTVRVCRNRVHELQAVLRDSRIARIKLLETAPADLRKQLEEAKEGLLNAEVFRERRCSYKIPVLEADIERLSARNEPCEERKRQLQQVKDDIAHWTARVTELETKCVEAP